MKIQIAETLEVLGLLHIIKKIFEWIFNITITGSSAGVWAWGCVRLDF